MDLEPGTLVADRYRIERALAKGGMGRVFVATDEKFGRRIALKVATGATAEIDCFKERFKREARIGNLLGQRPGFVRALDWGELDDGFRLYMTMDLVEEGQELDLTSGSLDERLARWRRAAELVQEAHDHGIIHRDLKPANFLQTPDGGISLTDFGLGKVIGESEPEEVELDSKEVTATGIGMGTPRYMPPEQFEDAKTVDARADVYALGVMLFFTLTGKHPFSGNTPTALISGQQKVLSGRAPLPRPRDHVADLDEDLDALVARAISLDASGRLASVDHLLKGLAGEPIPEVTPDSETAILPAPSKSEASTLVIPEAEALTVPPRPPWTPRRSSTGLLMALAVVGLAVGIVLLGDPDEPAPGPSLLAAGGEQPGLVDPPEATATPPDQPPEQPVEPTTEDGGEETGASPAPTTPPEPEVAATPGTVTKDPGEQPTPAPVPSPTPVDEVEAEPGGEIKDEPVDESPKPAPLKVRLAVLATGRHSGGPVRQVTQGATLRSGEHYKLVVEPLQACFLYVFQVDSAGTVLGIFPLEGTGRVEGRAEIPPLGDGWVFLDKTLGEETLVVVASRTAVEGLAALASRLRVDEDAGQAAEKELAALVTPLGLAKVGEGAARTDLVLRDGSSASCSLSELSGADAFVHQVRFKHR